MKVSARVRNYVKKNPETVEQWKNKAIKLHLLNILNAKYAPEEHKDREDFSLYQLTGNRGQNKICNDVLDEHFDLAFETVETVGQGYHRKRYTLVISTSTFEDMIKDLDEKPELLIIDQNKIYEDDVYTSLCSLSIGELAYIYHNQDEFAFMWKKRRGPFYYRNSENLGVIYKDLKEEADNLSFRNAIEALYENKMPLIGSVVCEKDFSMITEPEWVVEEGTHDTHQFQHYIKSVIPAKICEVNESNVGFLLDRVKHGIDHLNTILSQLQSMQASIKEAGGDAGFREKFYDKAIANFYRNIPLMVNSEDKDVKELVTRAAKKIYK